jgi:hypothetical protein
MTSDLAEQLSEPGERESLSRSWLSICPGSEAASRVVNQTVPGLARGCVALMLPISDMGTRRNEPLGRHSRD